MEARLRDKPLEILAEQVPNQDVKLSEDFIEKHGDLILAISTALVRAMVVEKAVDRDAKEALAALIQTYRTLDSGLIYETRTPNPFAAAVVDALKEAVKQLGQSMAEQAGMQTLRNADVLGTLVFLERLELQHDNGRKRGRAFLDFLRAYFPPEQPAAASLVL
jgi:hypothetical protein